LGLLEGVHDELKPLTSRPGRRERDREIERERQRESAREREKGMQSYIPSLCASPMTLFLKVLPSSKSLALGINP
jgi:hypothetical protein